MSVAVDHAAAPAALRAPAVSLSKSMISTSLASCLFTVFTFVSGVVLARTLGEVGRGQYGAATFWSQFLISFGSLSFFEAALVRRERGAAPEAHLSSLLAGSAILVLLASAVFVGAVELNLVRVPGLSKTALFAFVLGTLALSLLSRSMWTIEEMRQNFRLLNIERVIGPLMFALLSAGAALIGGGSVYGMMATFVLSTLPLLAIRLYRFRHALIGPLQTGYAAASFRLGARFHMAATLNLVATQLDRLIVVSIWAPERQGHYFVAVSVAGAGLSVVSQALGLTLLPMLAGVEGAARRDRVERLLRYTILATVLLVGVIYALTPIAVPLVYGPRFTPAIAYAQGLCLALAPLPVRAIVLEANRSLQKGRPGVEMALASLAAFLGVFLVTRFAQVSDLFVAIGLSNLAAIAVGLRHPCASGDLRLGSALVPRIGDFGFLASELVRYAKGLTPRRFRGRLR